MLQLRRYFPARLAPFVQCATLLTVAKSMSVTVSGGGKAEVNGDYVPKAASDIPKMFAAVCDANGWSTPQMWAQLNGDAGWFAHSENDSYIYFNKSDGKWWIDGIDGLGVYISTNNAGASVPPGTGWKPLDPKSLPLPQVTTDQGEL